MPISCQDYDYFEIACMYQLEVELRLKNGQLRVGRAQTLQPNQQRQECIVLDCATSQSPVQVVLEDIASMRAVTTNPHFNQVTLKE